MKNEQQLALFMSVALLVGFIVLGFMVKSEIRELLEIIQPSGLSLGATGDTASTTRTAIIAANVGSSTWCTLYNSGSRPRIITDFFVFKDSTSTAGAARVVHVATSTQWSGYTNIVLASTTLGLDTQAISKGFGIGGTSASTTGVGQFSPIIASTSAHYAVWGSGTYLNFVATSSLNLTESGQCGVNYFVGQ